METSRETFRFRDFALDVAGYQLRRNGRPVRLEGQPMDLLILLVERRLQLVSRSEIVDRLWGKDVFVDVETGVHTAIRKIRQALNDSPEAPVFVETVAGKGYRFIAPVEVVPASPPPPPAPPHQTRTGSALAVRAVLARPARRGSARRRAGRPRDVGLATHGQSRIAIDARRAALREPEWRSRSGVPRRWPRRGDHRLAWAD